MNIENLQKMAKHIKTIPQKLFTMQSYRSGTYENKETLICNTVGCAIGHCVHLDDDIENIPRHRFNMIDFQEWSYKFTELEQDEISWCFDSSWTWRDNTPLGAALRIEWLINNGLPENWKEQLAGWADLVYQENIETSTI